MKRKGEAVAIPKEVVVMNIVLADAADVIALVAVEDTVVVDKVVIKILITTTIESEAILPATTDQQ